MNTKLKRVVEVPVTPAESMTDYLVDHINAIMICCGIQTIEVQKYTSGFGSRLHVSMTPFPDAPSEVVKQGLVVKDAIAQILAVINLSKQSLSDFTDEEMSNIRSMWASSVEAAKRPRDATPKAPKADEDDIPLDLSEVIPKEASDKPEKKRKRNRKKK